MSVVESNDRRTMGKLVVITGGEPFRQANVIPFINVLMNQQYTVQIETNGTVDIPAMALHTKTSIAHWLPTNKAYRKKLVIVCSPKTASIREANAPYIHSFKYVLAAGKISPLDGLPTSALGYNQTVYRPWESSFISQPNIYVTPEDCGGLDWYANEEARQAYQDNLNTASHSATTFGYILGLQIHKYFHLA
jgi:organic radical activating enzyme